MANIADNYFKVYLPEEDSLKIEEIGNELKAISYEYFDIDYLDDSVIEINMGSKWTAPIEDFERICNTYGCHILGVSTEFGNGYVEAFDIHSEVFEEVNENHFIAIEAVPADEGSTLPIEGDENLL